MNTAKLIGCTSKYCFGDRQDRKIELVAAIMAKLLPENINIANVVSLRTDSTGCPHLVTSLPLSLNVSFSYCGDRIWSVIALDHPVGIDVEHKDSFGSGYPFSRVFSKSEQHRFQEIAPCVSSAAAAMWTCKEAVAKSMKSGFGKVEPLDLNIGAIQRSGDRFYVEINADKKYVALLDSEAQHWRCLAGPGLMTSTN